MLWNPHVSRKLKWKVEEENEYFSNFLTKIFNIPDSMHEDAAIS